MPESHPEGHLAVPAAGSGRPVLVLHAWWGLNDTIRSLCDRLADAGFVAFAPDLDHGEVASDIAGAERLNSALWRQRERARAEVAAAARFLRERSGSDDLAAIGFSMGAYYALDLSGTEPGHVKRVVVFYGSGPGDFAASRAEYLGHFAENDPYEPAEDLAALEEALRAAGRPATFHRYPGTGHWFFESDRTDAYDAGAADLAWERTLEFLGRP